MGSRYRISVVQGGPSEEAEVSRVSAKAVWEALKALGHVTARLELDIFTAETIRSGGYEMVFPVVHGERGEVGCLQGMLETLEVPYVGSGVLASALAMDKAIARHVFAAHGLRVAKGTLVPIVSSAEATEAKALETARALRAEIGAAIVLKPRASGSGLSVSRFETEAKDEDVAAALTKAWGEERELLCETFIQGAEVTCGVLDLGDPSGPNALASIEIESPNDAFYTFQARYAAGRSVHHCPGRFSADVEKTVQAMARKAFVALGCRDLARADFVVDGSKGEAGVTLLEVNTMPGFTEASLFPEAAAHGGMPFSALVDALVRRAIRRKPAKARAAATFPGGGR